jgi:hypothetical protein
VALFFLGLPNKSFSKEELLRRAGKDSAFGGDTLKDLSKDATLEEEKYDGNGQSYRIFKTRTGLRLKETTQANGETKLELVRGGEPIRMKFSELNDAAYDPDKRESLQGEALILEGHFKRLADKEFALFRMKMTCCKADEVPLKVRIIVPQTLSSMSDFTWVEVRGQLQFLKIPGQERYIPVLMVADINDITKKDAPADESER